MKTVKIALRYWFLSASLVTFLGGWLMLAHSPKPIQPAQNTSLNLTSLLQGSGETHPRRRNPGLFNSNPQVNSGFPILRTGGS